MTNKMHAHDSIQLHELTTDESSTVNGCGVGGMGDGSTELPPKSNKIVASSLDVHQEE